MLTINNSTSTSASAVACDTYTWSVDGNTYTTSGIYTLSSTNAAGCTHIDSLLLTINNSTSTSTNVTACDSYTWPLDSNTYTTSGIYTLSSTNASGCTHIDSLVLVIDTSTSLTFNIVACDTYTWLVNGQTYDTSGTYVNFSTNAAGCTHVDILKLDIRLSTSTSTNVTACDSYIWSVDGNVYTSSGIYTSSSTNVAGCTHIDSLVLTINNSTSASMSVVACDSYTWSFDGNIYTSSGIYTSTSINANGCTHTDSLDLTINYSTASTSVVTACDSYTWIDGNLSLIHI